MKKVISSITIDLLRHGECEGGAIFRGTFDALLSERGLQQMQDKCHQANTQWDAIFSSPLKRCAEFAQTWSEDSRSTFKIDERLREMSFGEWEGQLIEDVMVQDTDRFKQWQLDPNLHTPPNGEPLTKVQHRALDVVRSVEQNHQNKHVLLICHGGLIRVLLASLLEIPLAKCKVFDVPYACISRIAIYQWDDGRRDIKLLAHNLSS